MKKVQLTEIAGGALQEKFNKSFEKVIENLLDPNTPYKEARKIQITLKFTQNEARDDVACDVSVIEKISAPAQTRTAFSIGKDLRKNTVFAEEYGKNQMSIADLDVNRETGEVAEPATEVVDLRKVFVN